MRHVCIACMHRQVSQPNIFIFCYCFICANTNDSLFKIIITYPRLTNLGFIEFIVSPSLEICGDVLDRVHYQMAEANTRPALPASAKAASVVAAVTTGKSATQVVPTIERARDGPRAIAELDSLSEETASTTAEQPDSRSITSTVSVSGKTHSRQSDTDRNRQQQNELSGSSISVASSSQSTTSGQSTSQPASTSFASSFVSSETLTSNLRKMIASSSASISRKLNISSSSSATSTTSSSNNNNNTVAPTNNSNNPAKLQQQQPQKPQQLPVTPLPANVPTRTETSEEFEARQANYKHPVIQCESAASSSLRLKSAFGRLSSSSQVRNPEVGQSIHEYDHQAEHGTDACQGGGGGGSSSNSSGITGAPAPSLSNKLPQPSVGEFSLKR